MYSAPKSHGESNGSNPRYHQGCQELYGTKGGLPAATFVMSELKSPSPSAHPDLACGAGGM